MGRIDVIVVRRSAAEVSSRNEPLCRLAPQHGLRVSRLRRNIIGEEVPQKMVVEDRSAHVVARSGSPSSDRTNSACWSRVTRSSSSLRPVPLGTVNTPKPRSITSTGPPPSRCHRCRAPAGSDIWPDADTRYSRTLMRTGYLVPTHPYQVSSTPAVGHHRRQLGPVRSPESAKTS